MTVVTDDFNRANGAVGAAWTMVPTGDGTPTFSIVSNKVQNTTTGGTFGKYARHDTATGSNDMSAQGVVSSTQANAGSNSGTIVRGQTGATNTSYQFTGRHAGDTFSFFRIVAGTETQLRLACNATGSTGASASLAKAWASGDTIRAEVVGSLLRGKLNGALIAVTRDTSVATGQRGGLNCYNAVGGELAEFDDFRAAPLDDLSAAYLCAVGAQAEGVGTTLTPAALDGLTAGDLFCVHAISRDAAQAISFPAGEGWVQIQLPTQSGLESVLFAKVLGLGGQTDDTTPTFSIGAGTAGWGLTPFALRNPAHATSPWTSVAAAIVASASQANASNATATAPSATDTGTHRTVVRLFDSADDNALGLSSTATTNSEGALGYGGVDYDSLQGNDFAQAMSVLEDVTLAGSTGTATVTETLVGPDVSNGITFVVGIPSGSTVNLTPAQLNLSGVALSPVPGVVTVNLTPAQLNLSGVALSPAPGLVTAPLTPASLSLSGVALSPAPLPVVVSLTPAQLSLAAVALAAIPGAVSVPLVPAQLSLSGVGLAPVPGLVTVPLTPAQLVLTGVALSPSAGGSTVVLTPAVLQLSAVPLTPVPGAVSVPLVPAVLVLDAVPLTTHPGFVVVELAPAGLILEGVALIIAPPGPGIQVMVGELALLNKVGDVVLRARTDELHTLTAVAELVLRQAVGEMDIRYDVGELEAEP